MKKTFIFLLALLFSASMFAQELQVLEPRVKEATLSLDKGGEVGKTISSHKAMATSSEGEIRIEQPATGTTRGQVFFDGFETATGNALPAGWISTNGSDASDWITVSSLTSGFSPYTGNVMAVHLWNETATQARNAWMITPGVTLTAGKSYAVRFRLAQPGYPDFDEYDYFKVKIAQTPTAGAMESSPTTAYYNTTTWIPNWTLIQYTFTPSSTGTYYIGFHAFTPVGEGDFIAVDDVEVFEAETGTDCEIAEIITPNSGMNLSATSPVKVLIKNNGSTTLTNFGLELKLGTTVMANVTYSGPAIPSLGQAEYTFATTLNLSAAGTYDVTVTANATGDVVPANNAKTKSVTNTLVTAITPPWTEPFTNTTFPPTSWNRLHTGGSTGTWARRTTALTNGPTVYDGAFACRPDVSGTGQVSHLITPAITIPTTGSYVLQFMSYTGYTAYYAQSSIDVSTTVNNSVSAFSPIYILNGTDVAASWQKLSINLSAYKGQTIYLAFVYRGDYSHNWGIDNVSIIQLPDNDLALSAAYPMTQVPVSQTLTPSHSGKVTNAGAQTQTGIVFTTNYNGTNIGTATHPSLASGANVTLTATTPVLPVPLGNNTLTYSVSQTETDEVPGNNIVTGTLTGTEHTFAVDNGTSMWNIGNSTPISLGNIFTITNQVELNAVQLRFSASTPTSFSISLYAMGATVPNNPAIFTQTATKPTTAGWITVGVPATTLAPGKYFLCANQTGNTSFSLNADGDVRMGYAIYSNTFYEINTLYGNTIGAPMIRMLVDMPQNDIQLIAENPLVPYTKVPESQAPGAMAAVMSFPATLTAQAFNTGKATQNNIVFSATLNGASLGSSTPLATLAPYTTSAAMTITPTAGTAYPTTAGTYDMVYKVQQTATDDNPTDNSATYTLEIGNKYQLDAISVLDNGVGSNTGTISAGNIFNIYAPTVLYQVEIGINSGGKPYTLSLFRLNGTTISGAALFTTASATTVSGFTTVAVPATLLTAGDYYLCINQTSGGTEADNISLAYDSRTNARRLYTKAITGGNGTALSAQASFGAGAIRMITKDPLHIYITNLTPTMGTTSPNVTTPYAEGATPTYTFTPNVTYHVKEVKVNGTVVLTGNMLQTQTLTYNFPPLTADATVTVEFERNTAYTLTFNPNGGSVSPTSIPVYANSPIGEMPIPTLLGHTFAGWKLNGVTPIDEFTVWTTGNGSATASWTPSQYTLTLNAAPGTISGSNTVTVTYGSQIGTGLVTPTPPANCQFGGWFIDGTQIYQYTLWNYAENKTAQAVYNYGISVQSSGPGSHTPTGAMNYYAPGATPSYTFTPTSPSAHIASITVDGVTPSGFTLNAEASLPFTYTFTALTAPHAIVVTYAQNCYAMNPANNIHPQVSVTPTACVQHGSNVTYTFTANCVQITGITVGGVTLPTNTTTYTLPTPLTGPQPVIVITAIDPHYTITATPALGVDPMGYITPSGVTEPLCSASTTYTFHTTDDAYRVKTLLIDGISVPVPVTQTYTFPPITANRTIHLEFEERPYYIIEFGPSAGENLGGSVYPTLFPDKVGYYAVDSGMVEVPFTITPATGYVIDKVYVDNTLIPSAVISGSYTFYNVLTNHTIFATFKKIMFTITATTDPNGYITPSGIVSVAYGTDKTFDAEPKPGYKLDAIIVDGVINAAATASGSYTFENVTANHTISANFVKKTYQITTTAGAHGTIAPVNPMVPHGDNKTIYFYPSIGYVVNQVLVDGIPIGAPNSYTFVNVTAEHTISVTFAKEKFTITTTYQGGGDNSFVTPAGVATLEYDEHSEIYVFHSAEGYHVKSALVDGFNDAIAVEEGMYRFLNVKANHTLHVIFAKDNLTITATATEGGTINPAGAIVVPYNTDRTFYFEAAAGYKLARVLIDGIDHEELIAVGQYTFEKVEDDHTIAAQFERKPYNVIYEEVLGAIVVPVDGSVSPVEYGGKYKFTVTLLAGYSQSDITVRANGLILTPVGDVYAINNIASDQYITINGVALNLYKIVAKAHDGGTITPAGTFMVEYGDHISFEIVPNAKYKISDVLVNGTSVGAVTTYMLNNVSADNKIDAYFEYDSGVGIDENSGATITVFSHQNVVTIMNKDLVPVKQVEIMDMYGRLVWSGPALTEKTDITLDVAKGVYAVRVITSDNNPITAKVVID